MNKKWIPIFILFSGCAVGPNYKAPETSVSENWNCQETLLSPENPIVAWWELFQDPLLSKYIHLAREHNFDLLTATSNILQARAFRQMAASSFFPQIGADVNATKNYFSKNGPIFASEPSIGEVPGTVSPLTGFPFDLQFPQMQSLYNALVDVSWEIDLFGKTRRTVESANATIQVATEVRNDTLITIMAEIASNYISLRSSQEMARLIQENISLLEKEVFLVKQQFEKGYVSKLALETLFANLAREKAQLPEIEAKIHQNIYAISVLTGSMPETLLEELLKKEDLPTPPDIIAIGLKSDLLRRRPDVRSVERQLAAATANIGVAVASFFPTITLIGDVGLQSLKLTNLFKAKSKTWGVGGDINMPIFQGGQLIGNLKANQAEAAATAYAYQQTVLEAFEETESAIIAYINDIKTEQQKKEEKDHFEELAHLTRERQEKGLVNLLEVLESEKDVNVVDQSLLESKTRSLLDVITLYKALGGGWENTFQIK